jgi:hypothetical protein
MRVIGFDIGGEDSDIESFLADIVERTDHHDEYI